MPSLHNFVFSHYTTETTHFNSLYIFLTGGDKKAGAWGASSRLSFISYVGPNGVQTPAGMVSLALGEVGGDEIVQLSVHDGADVAVLDARAVVLDKRVGLKYI